MLIRQVRQKAPYPQAMLVAGYTEASAAWREWMLRLSLLMGEAGG